VFHDLRAKWPTHDILFTPRRLVGNYWQDASWLWKEPYLHRQVKFMSDGMAIRLAEKMVEDHVTGYSRLWPTYCAEGRDEWALHFAREAEKIHRQRRATLAV
jgi:hypothetical protein